jgi:hypothetical protein
MDDKNEYGVEISYFTGGRHGAVGHPRSFLHWRHPFDLGGHACNMSREFGSVARAALAPSTTVVSTGAAVPVLAATIIVGAWTAGATTEGGHCSEGKDQQYQGEGLYLHGHYGSSHSR